MRILELPNKQKFEITEEECNEILKAGEHGQGTLLNLPRLQIAFTTFGIFIYPIPHQLKYGLPYILLDAAKKKWRVFLIGKEFILKSETEGNISMGTIEALKSAGCEVALEDEFISRVWKNKKLELENKDLEKEKIKRLSKTNP